jgi:hypothetical protein
MNIISPDTDFGASILGSPDSWVVGALYCT